MTRKTNEKEILEEYLAGTAIPETSLSTLGNSPPMATGQGAISAALANGRAMESSVAQAQNSQSISQAQTTTGVASLLKRQPRFKNKRRHIRNFLEQVRLFET